MKKKTIKLSKVERELFKTEKGSIERERESAREMQSADGRNFSIDRMAKVECEKSHTNAIMACVCVFLSEIFYSILPKKREVLKTHTMLITNLCMCVLLFGVLRNMMLHGMNSRALLRFLR